MQNANAEGEIKEKDFFHRIGEREEEGKQRENIPATALILQVGQQINADIY